MFGQRVEIPLRRLQERIEGVVLAMTEANSLHTSERSPGRCKGSGSKGQPAWPVREWPRISKNVGAKGHPGSITRKLGLDRAG